MTVLFSDRIARANRYDRICTLIERPFRSAVMQLKNRYIDAQLEAFKRTGKLSDELTDSLSSALEQTFLKYQARVIQLTSIETVRQLDRSKSIEALETKREKWEYYLRQWASREGGKNARDTATTTRDDLNKLITAAFDAGEDETAVISAGLKAKGYSAFRADTIARTETHNAATFAARETVKDYSVEIGAKMLKFWQPVIDDRTREDHAAMAGQPGIPIDQPFEVGGESLDYPGDPNGSAENTINCRCVALYEVSTEE